jgi:hypothetical protein
MTASDAIPSWLFRRLLGLVYLFAFWSLASQITGLIGHDGILPAQTYVNEIREWAATQQVGIDRFRLFPTLAWISTSDGFLFGLSVTGVALSALLVLGVAPLAVLPILWLLYLSFTVVGQEFLLYQWDALLLETGFLAIFVAPAVWLDRLRSAASPPRLGKWLLLWLLFRLNVGSGAIKLASGDLTWRNLTAVSFHYYTQPIPTPLAWYAHQAPLWLGRVWTAAMLGIELVAPWLMLGGRRARRVAFALLVSLQAVIALTGNYAFFNLLTIALCVLLLDDRVLPPPSTPPFSPSHGAAVKPVAAFRIRRALVTALALVSVPVSTFLFASSLGVALPGGAAIAPLADAIAPFRSVNVYGLFAVMTPTRPEIIVEGSDDGRTWRPYEFAYKPGEVKRAPPWVAPHQPRLDWQMWFAALGDSDQAPWFRRFCLRLLQGSPDVLRLIGDNPFPDHPPRYIRAMVYRYRFTDRATRRATGAWWTRELLGEFQPPLSLDPSQ